MEVLYKFCYGLTAFLGVVQGLFVLYKNPRSRVNVTWALMNFAVAIWALEGPLAFFAIDYKTALLWWRIADLAAVFIPVFFTHFCLALLDKPLKESRAAVAGYIYAVILGSFSFTPWFISGVSTKLCFRWFVEPGPLYVVFTIQFFSLVFYAHWLLFRHLHSQPRKRQDQIKYVIAATIFGYACGSTTFLLVYDIPFNPLPSLLTFVYAGIITHAIVKHQLMDIKVAITRAGVLLGTYLVVLGIPFVVGWWGRGWLERQFAEQWWVVPLGLCTVLATIGPFAYAALRNQVERRFLKTQRQYRQALQHAARGMTRLRSVAKLSRMIVRVVSRSVRLDHASLFLFDPNNHCYILTASAGAKRFAMQSRYRLDADHDLIRHLRTIQRVLTNEDADQSRPQAIARELTNLRAMLIVPGFIEDELVGFLALGAKHSGAGYSSDDLHAFSTLANEAAVAIENARSYEELARVNEQLRLAYDRLVTQERLVAAGQFATGMAHEIKNPLSAIKTFAEYLPEKYKDPAFREKFFRIVQSEIDRINTLVKELSDFARPSPPQLQGVSISALMADVLALLSTQCMKQGVEVVNAFKENGLLLQADPQQIKQALLNLILNSLEAMPAGGRLEITSQVAGDRLWLQVKDSGCGIPPEHHERLWDPFFTTKERGMGLGLAIVKGIIERHGGSISLHSQVDIGTTVELSLPVSSS